MGALSLTAWKHTHTHMHAQTRCEEMLQQCYRQRFNTKAQTHQGAPGPSGLQRGGTGRSPTAKSGRDPD